MFYLFWVTAAIILYIIVGVLSKYANDSEEWKWVIFLYVCNFFGLWPIIARYSKNIVFDGLLYDLIIYFTFYGTLLFMGAAAKFTTYQWAGTFLVGIGFILLKIGGK